MSSKILQLNVGSRDLSQAEKEITACKPEQIHKLSKNSCHFKNLLIAQSRHQS